MAEFRILRQTPEVFTVEAESFQDAVDKVVGGEVQESESMLDTYELVDEEDRDLSDILFTDMEATRALRTRARELATALTTETLHGPIPTKTTMQLAEMVLELTKE